MMLRSALPILLVVVAVASLGALGLATVPQYTTLTQTTMSTQTVLNPQGLIAYSYSTLTCVFPGNTCYAQVTAFTVTSIWSGQTTLTRLFPTVSARSIHFAVSGFAGTLMTLIAAVVLICGAFLLARGDSR